MKQLAAILLAVATAVTLSACASSAPSSKPHAAAATSAAPSSAATEITLTPKGGCADEADWRDSGGLMHITKVGHWIGKIADDEDRADTAAIQRDGTRLYAVAEAAKADPPPMDRGKYLRALRLAQKATVDAQAGDYQASTTAITETTDLFTVMVSDLKAQCGV